MNTQCPALSELPAPPSGKTGWPWTIGTPKVPDARADGSAWPRVSVVTPSYNQCDFLEETIRSVLLQGYPNLEYIIIDGASTDRSVEIIRDYEQWLSYWVSDKDDGQADAINKGLRICTGEIFQWINSDDVLNAGALSCVASQMSGHDCVAGAVTDFDATGYRAPRPSRRLEPVNFILRPHGFLYHQPGVWLRTDLVRQLGGFDSAFHYKFDWEFAIRYLERWPRIGYVDSNLAFFRLHADSKTVSNGEEFGAEELFALESLADKLVTSKARAACMKILQKKHWRRRVDEILTCSDVPNRRALWQLCSEALRDPLNRLDRYTLGALRRLVMAL